MMIYRRTYQSNIYQKDTFLKEKENVDRLADETFNIHSIALYTNEGVYYVNDTVASEVIESLNYFTIRYTHQKGAFTVLKYSNIYKIEFILDDDN